MNWKLCVVPTLSAVLIGCGSPNESSETVSKKHFEELGLRWPLTVADGIIGCDGMARWFERDGVRYGLNGLASSEKGYEPIEPIWTIDAELMKHVAKDGGAAAYTPRINIGDLSDRAGKLCAS